MSSASPDALELVRRELAPAEGGNRLVPLVAEGRLPRERLAAIAGEEYRIIASDRRSFLLLAARFPEPPAGEFFIGLAQGENLALPLLIAYAGALGWDERDLRAYEPQAGCQAYAAYVAWLALNAAKEDVALALVANFARPRRRGLPVLRLLRHPGPRGRAAGSRGGRGQPRGGRAAGVRAPPRASGPGLRADVLEHPGGGRLLVLQVLQP